MLEKLTIKNIALIRNQTIEFKDGLVILSGETGAGKSLIIDSISLLLGEKADRSLISSGEDFAVVEAVFTGISDNIKEIMNELGLEEDDVIIITRKLTREGKNDCKVNGQTFSLSMLRKLTAPLMDLHGQFQHQNLLKVQNHLILLDKFGGKEIAQLKSEYQEKYRALAGVEDQLQSLISDDKERQRLLDLYKYQIDEIKEASFYDGEEEELKDIRNQVIHQEKIIETLNNVVSICDGDGYQYFGMKDTLKKIETLLGGISSYNKDIDEVIARIDSLKLDFEDIFDTIQDKRDNLFIDEQKAKENEERLDLLSSFKKKYGADIKTINEYCDKITEIYDGLINAEDTISRLKIEKVELEKQIKEIANALTLKRKEIAKTLESQIKQELVGLGMKSARFYVNFTDFGIENRNINGFDGVEFMFSANLGEPEKPLKDVASGGEMSRLMLAIKNITAKLDGIGTLIFDEIDTGVSGQNALALAQKLSLVSRYSQVICVTHLATVVSFGDMNVLVSKYENDGKTTTMVSVLDQEGCAKEVARLISGNVTESSLTSAKEMINNAKNFKKNII